MDPARSLILQFSVTGKLSEGIDTVAAIVKRDRTSVYRWMLDTSDGGTGGIIPGAAQRELREYALKNRVPAGIKQLFGATRAA